MANKLHQLKNTAKSVRERLLLDGFKEILKSVYPYEHFET